MVRRASFDGDTVPVVGATLRHNLIGGVLRMNGFAAGSEDVGFTVTQNDYADPRLGGGGFGSGFIERSTGV